MNEESMASHLDRVSGSTARVPKEFLTRAVRSLIITRNITHGNPANVLHQTAAGTTNCFQNCAICKRTSENFISSLPGLPECCASIPGSRAQSQNAPVCGTFMRRRIICNSIWRDRIPTARNSRDFDRNIGLIRYPFRSHNVDGGTIWMRQQGETRGGKRSGLPIRRFRGGGAVRVLLKGSQFPKRPWKEGLAEV